MEAKEIATKHWRLIVCGVLLVLNCLVWYAAIREDRRDTLTVSILDVGQGDAIFIEAPNGNQLLVDGGPPGRIASALSEVMPFYDRSIDLLALTHPHLDHFGGFIDVLGRYEVGGIVTSGTENPTPDYESFKSAEKEAGLEEIVLRYGQRISLGAQVYVDVLLPAGDASDASPHNGMLVMRLTYASTSMLLTGDMESNLEDYLVRYGSGDLKSDVLKVGHHGSKTSTSEPFLSLVKPKAALISLGADNKYGHPNKETLDVLERFNVSIYRTDQLGTLTFTSNGNGIDFSRLLGK